MPTGHRSLLSFPPSEAETHTAVLGLWWWYCYLLGGRGRGVAVVVSAVAWLVVGREGLFGSGGDGCLNWELQKTRGCWTRGACWGRLEVFARPASMCDVISPSIGWLTRGWYRDLGFYRRRPLTVLRSSSSYFNTNRPHRTLTSHSDSHDPA